MTRQHNHHDDRRSTAPPEHTPRLRLKAKAPLTGHFDGAWWPHSDSLPTELPDLLAVLSVRQGPIDRVLYPIGEWTTAPAKLVIGDRTIRLDGYRQQPSRSIEILGLNRTRIKLLVVPPDTDAEAAHTTMMAAASPNNSSTASDLLGITLRENNIQAPTGVSIGTARW